MTLARTLYEIFYENSTAYAEGYVNGGGKVAYRTHDGLPDLQQIQDHLDKQMVLGAYTLQPGSVVSWAAFDVDAKDLNEARKLAYKISDYLTSKGIPHGIEFSGSKGYHIWIFFTNKEPADAVKAVMEKMREVLGMPKTGDPHVEIFPKQGEITQTNPYGNLLRLPLGAHPRTKNEAFFVTTLDWEKGDALDPAPIFAQKTTLEALQKAVESSDVFEQILGVLTPYWTSGQRHDVTLSVSGFLAQSGWSQEDTVALVEAIHEVVPEGDLKDQLKAVETTYKRFHNGENILGLSGLGKIFPASDLNTLVELVGKKSSPAPMLAIDGIRLGKSPTFLKVRSAAMTVVSSLQESGRLVRDTDDMFWLDHGSHDLLEIDTHIWTRFLHNFFGINASEGFGRQTIESVRHLAYDRAKEVTVKRRAHWAINGEVEMINLGGPEIYVFNGDPGDRKIIYNGEGDILFKNTSDRFHLPNLFASSEAAMSPWPFLSDDVNFKLGEDGTTPEQQRELYKAAFLSTFFAEIMPTKPIVAILADSGYGKTTTARRPLRILEGTDSDVLSVNDDKPDSFRASIVAHRYIVLDNLEENKAIWLPDQLNRVSTGAHLELRELHTTNQLHRYKPNCFIALTATKMPFPNETVYSRMLPIELGPVRGRRSEHLIQMDLINNFNSIWKGIFDVIDQLVYELRQRKQVNAPEDLRLADFSIFCHKIKDAPCLDGDTLIQGLDNLVNRQRYTLKQNSSFIDVIEAMMQGLPGGDTGWISLSELYARAQKTASLNKIEWRWTTVQALSKHIGVLEGPLIQHFGMSVRTGRQNGREVKEYRFVREKI